MLGYPRQRPDGYAVVSAQHEREAALFDDIVDDIGQLTVSFEYGN